MFYIVALGNPGDKYRDTRHNVGWLAMDYCREKFQLPEPVDSRELSGRVSRGLIQNEEVEVLYPQTYMNNSGSAVVKMVAKNELQRLIVIHDDIDLPFGEIKVVKGRGAGGNNGVQSIVQKLGSKEFIRVRIGIAPKSFWTGKVKRPAGGGPLERFVLKSFSPSEKRQLPDIFTQVQKAISLIVSDGVEEAMNVCN